MLLSLRKNGLTTLFKEVRVFKAGPGGGGFGGGRVQRGRSGWEGSVAPPASLDLKVPLLTPERALERHPLTASTAPQQKKNSEVSDCLEAHLKRRLKGSANFDP